MTQPLTKSWWLQDYKYTIFEWRIFLTWYSIKNTLYTVPYWFFVILILITCQATMRLKQNDIIQFHLQNLSKTLKNKKQENCTSLVDTLS